DDAGFGETLTSAATAAVVPPPPPAKPSGLSISTEPGSLDVSVDWNDVDGSDFYWVRWRPVDGTLNEGVEVASSDATITVSDYGEWVVRAQACNDSGCGQPVAKRFEVESAPEPTPTAKSEPETAGASTEPPPPPAPTNLAVSDNGDGTLTLTWDAPDDDSVTGYQILRRRPQEGEKALLVYVEDTGSTATTWIDRDVTLGTRHTYRVKAINAAGLSEVSNFDRATPQAPPEENSPASE
ncbi:MAG: fibronectin type III domain-containing protein, partial [Caldilineaceae bacterium]|nr:fibronectin type III domain-containing protein [Caldilineaceae bacterium]